MCKADDLDCFTAPLCGRGKLSESPFWCTAKLYIFVFHFRYGASSTKKPLRSITHVLSNHGEKAPDGFTMLKKRTDMSDCKSGTDLDVLHLSNTTSKIKKPMFGHTVIPLEPLTINIG